MKKKIGILGSGAVAKALASGFLKHGYEVMTGSRDKNKLSDFASKEPSIKIGDFRETASYADILILAVKGSAAKEALLLAGQENIKNKVVIDATNPIDTSPPVKGVLNFFTDLKKSLMEDLQENFPEARFVKAFNSVGSAHMVNPDFGGIKPSMFICGNNSEAKGEAKNILQTFGWEVEDMGEAESARAIEPLCILWCIRGFKEGQWNHAFKLLKKQ